MLQDYRYINLQLNISRDEREPAAILTNHALKEYERLQLDSPTICDKSIIDFKKKFKNNNQAIPDIIDDKFIIKINKHNKNNDDANIKNNDDANIKNTSPKFKNNWIFSNNNDIVSDIKSNKNYISDNL